METKLPSTRSSYFKSLRDKKEFKKQTICVSSKYIYIASRLGIDTQFKSAHDLAKHLNIYAFSGSHVKKIAFSIKSGKPRNGFVLQKKSIDKK